LAELEAIEGIGKTIAQKIHEIFTTDSFKELTELIDATPDGVREIMRIKGIGPKKVAIIWKEMGVESIGELLYACKENRLAQFKGFGLKTQEAVIKQIDFMFASADKFHYAKAYAIAQNLIQNISDLEFVDEAELTGEIRRKLEILTGIDLLIATTDERSLRDELEVEIAFEMDEDKLLFQGYPVRLFTCLPSDFAYQLFITTAVEGHSSKIKMLLPEPKKDMLLFPYQPPDVPLVWPVPRKPPDPDISQLVGNVDVPAYPVKLSVIVEELVIEACPNTLCFDSNVNNKNNRLNRRALKNKGF
jgi:DNA polymerase (family 10)